MTKDGDLRVVQSRPTASRRMLEQQSGLEKRPPSGQTAAMALVAKRAAAAKNFILKVLVVDIQQKVDR